jgi:hypothetical protein
MFENTSRLLEARENLRSGRWEVKVDPVAEADETSVIDKTGCGCPGSRIVEEGWESLSASGRGLMDKKVPTEESPSCKEAREMTASSILDKRPGNKGWALFFIFRTARGMSSFVHLRLVGRRTVEGERTWIVSGDNGREGDIVWEVGLV